MKRWLLALLLACGGEVAQPDPAPDPAPAVPAPSDALAGDAERGRDLALRFECHRCHEGTGHDAPPREKQCVGCHRDVLGGEVAAPRAELERWQSHLISLPVAPSLRGVGRFEAAWLVAFLQRPVDLRPHLPATMPRLAIDDRDARDLAAYLLRDAPPRRAVGDGDPDRGERIVAARSCGGCHLRGGRPIGEDAPGSADARMLAPDLSFVADRFRADLLVQWLRDPVSLHPDARMPSFGLDDADARDIAAFLRQSVDHAAPPVPERLPLLEREVTWEEVERRVFRGVCWHCHSDPDLALGDGGPGNTGGFGFEGRRVDLGSYEGVMSGGLDDEGRRASLFREVEIDGERLPLVVAVLRARQLEQAGRPVPGLTGMPLGLPAAAPEDIQALETWIAQGRRR